jgi:hypothetical protein
MIFIVTNEMALHVASISIFKKEPPSQSFQEEEVVTGE